MIEGRIIKGIGGFYYIETEKSDTTGQGSVMNNNQATIKVDTTIDNKDEE